MENNRIIIKEEILSSYINAAELNMIAQSLVDICKKYKVNETFILNGLEILEKDIEANNLAMKKERANEYTPLVRQKEEARKNAFIAIRDTADAATKRIKTDIKETALRITALIKKRGWTIYKEPYAEQLKGINHLLEDFENEDVKKDLNTLGLTSYVSDLIEIHEEFKNTFSSRLENSTKWDEISPADAKEALFDAVAAFTGAMNLLGMQHPGLYNTVLKEMNESIASAMTTARARKSRESSAQDEDDAKN